MDTPKSSVNIKTSFASQKLDLNCNVFPEVTQAFHASMGHFDVCGVAICRKSLPIGHAIPAKISVDDNTVLHLFEPNDYLKEFIFYLEPCVMPLDVIFSKKMNSKVYKIVSFILGQAAVELLVSIKSDEQRSWKRFYSLHRDIILDLIKCCPTHLRRSFIELIPFDVPSLHFTPRWTLGELIHTYVLNDNKELFYTSTFAATRDNVKDNIDRIKSIKGQVIVLSNVEELELLRSIKCYDGYKLTELTDDTPPIETSVWRYKSSVGNTEPLLRGHKVSIKTTRNTERVWPVSELAFSAGLLFAGGSIDEEEYRSTMEEHLKCGLCPESRCQTRDISKHLEIIKEKVEALVYDINRELVGLAPVKYCSNEVREAKCIAHRENILGVQKEIVQEAVVWVSDIEDGSNEDTISVPRNVFLS